MKLVLIMQMVFIIDKPGFVLAKNRLEKNLSVFYFSDSWQEWRFNVYCQMNVVKYNNYFD